VYWVNVLHSLEVHDWQVHNEPDAAQQQGWGGILQDYVVFTQVTHDAIRHVYETYLPAEKTFRLYAPVAKGLNTWVGGIAASERCDY
jgi:hypothetical protein